MYVLNIEDLNIMSASAVSTTATAKEQEIAEKLRILGDKFTANLTQYQTTYGDYKSLLESKAMIASAVPIDPSANSTVDGTIGATIAGKAELYATVPNATYWGQTGLSEGTSNSPTECLADCYSKPACSGATYDSDTKYCWIRTGDGRIAQGKQNQTAIIKKSILYAYQLKDLNAKLQKINTEITDLINDNASVVAQSEQLKAQKQTLLVQTHSILSQNKQQLSFLENEHATLQAANENSSLMVNRNYYQYILYLFGAIILGVLLFKILIIPDSAPNSGLMGMGMRGGGTNYRSLR
jgi:hypothetical protein